MIIIGKKKKICPRCGKEYDEYPATSRRDNKTEICSKCGTHEALMDLHFSQILDDDIKEKLVKIERNWLKKENK